MGRIYDAVKSYFAETEWVFEERPDENLIVFPISGNNGNWLGIANAIESDEQLVVHSRLPEPVPAERRTEVTLLLTRANFGRAIGNFELDLDDGELRFKTSVDLEGSDIQPALIRQLMLANVVTMDLYVPAIAAVIGGAQAQEALRTISS